MEESVVEARLRHVGVLGGGGEGNGREEGSGRWSDAW